MSSYQERIEEFANNREFKRLTRPLRDRADAICDACGSPQPRTLYGLKDVAAGRYYFVGHSCLGELSKLGVVLRSFCIDAIGQAYEREQELRAQDSGASEEVLSGAMPDPDRVTEDGSANRTQEPERRQETNPFTLTALIREVDGKYQAYVFAVSPDGLPCGWGWAEENRFEEGWGITENLVLERISAERPEAMKVCISQAAENAWSILENSPLSTTLMDLPSRHHDILQLPELISNLITISEKKTTKGGEL